MIARGYDGNIIKKDSKIYMPHPARFGITDRMGRGPYEKSAMIRDTGLPPLRTVKESFEIPFPYKDIKKGKNITRNITTEEMEVEVRLLYLPFGEMSDDHYVWYTTRKVVSLK